MCADTIRETQPWEERPSLERSRFQKETSWSRFAGSCVAGDRAMTGRHRPNGLPSLRTTFQLLALPLRRAAVTILVLGLLAACSTTGTLEVAPPATPTSLKYASMVVDAGSGAVLFSTNADQPRYPASLTKMMTLYMLFEAIEAGRVSRTTLIPVSDYARARPPSKIGFKRGQAIDVDMAIRALCVKSANDVAVAVAEFLGGTEEQFAQMMTAKARQLGMRDTTFRNASGLPDELQRTTARDMALLGMMLRRRFPAQYAYFASTSFSYNGRTIRGHNDLIGGVDGVDGIKTGYIRASGYNIVTSVNRSGRGLVVVVMGGDSAKSRNAHVQELIARYLPAAKPGV
jgi:D-alanyl-D-alanine carboxypeptidase